MSSNSATVARIIECADELLIALSMVVRDAKGKQSTGSSDAFDVETVTSVREKLLSALSHINTIDNIQSSPIYSLPTELLGRIFVVNIPSFESQAADDRETVVTRRAPILHFGMQAGWSPLQLSAVSRHWRIVAVNLPILWSVFPFRSTPEGAPERVRQPSIEWGVALARLFLERSGNMPLDVLIWKQHPSASGRVRDLFSGNEARIRSLFLDDITSDIHGNCRALDAWTLPLPGLESLQLVKGVGSPHGGAPRHVVVNLNFLRPSLSHLELKHIDSWTGSGVPNLTTLVLRESGRDIPYPQFLDFLASIPRLERLFVKSYRARDYEASSTRRVDLPCLKQVYLQSMQPFHIASLLTHIRPASSLSLCVEWNAGEIDIQQIEATLDIIAQLEGFRDIYSIRASLEEFRGGRLYCCNFKFTFQSDCLTVSLLWMNVNASTPFSTLSRVLSTRLAPCPIAEVWCGTGAPFLYHSRGASLAELLLHTSKATTFGLEGSAFDTRREGPFSLPMHLTSDTVVQFACGTTPLLPNLQEIRVASKRDGDPLDLSRVEGYLRERKARKFPVLRLLQRCDTYEHWVPKLRDLVDEVKLVDAEAFTSCAHLTADNTYATLYHEH